MHAAVAPGGTSKLASGTGHGQRRVIMGHVERELGGGLEKKKARSGSGDLRPDPFPESLPRIGSPWISAKRGVR